MHLICVLVFQVGNIYQTTHMHFWESKSLSSLRDKSAAAGFICVPQQEHKNIWREIKFLSIAESEKDSCTKRQLTRTKARERKAFSKEKRTSVNQSNAERCPLQIPKWLERTVPQYQRPATIRKDFSI